MVTGLLWTQGVCDEDYDVGCTPTGHPPFDNYLESGWIDFYEGTRVNCVEPLPIFSSGEPLPEMTYEEMCREYIERHKGFIGPVSG